MLRIISGLCCVAMAAANTPMLHQDTLKDVAERSLAALAACDQTLSGAYVTPTGHLVDFQSLFKLSGVPSKAYGSYAMNPASGDPYAFFFTPCVDSKDVNHSHFKTCSLGAGSVVQFDNSDPSNPKCIAIIMHWIDPTDGTGGSFALVDHTNSAFGFTGYWANGDSSPGCATASGRREITITFTCQADDPNHHHPATFEIHQTDTACSYTADFASTGGCPFVPPPPSGKCALIEGDPPIYKPVCAGATTNATCAPLNATCVWVPTTVPDHCDVKAGEPVAYKAICEGALNATACSALNRTCAWGNSSLLPFL